MEFWAGGFIPQELLVFLLGSSLRLSLTFSGQPPPCGNRLARLQAVEPLLTGAAWGGRSSDACEYCSAYKARGGMRRVQGKGLERAAACFCVGVRGGMFFFSQASTVYSSEPSSPRVREVSCVKFFACLKSMRSRKRISPTIKNNSRRRTPGSLASRGL